VSDKHIFIDFDFTLSDQVVLTTQYVREAARVCAPEFGGEIGAWEHATARMLEAVNDEYLKRWVGNPVGDYSAWLDEMRVKAMRMLFETVGAALPPDPLQTAKELQFAILSVCDASYPGAVEMMAELFEQDFRVQIASANDSEWLLAALIGAGSESFTESKFGPDLVGCAKEGPDFFRRIFEASGVSPENALVVDDLPKSLEWAMETGAPAVQACLSTERHYPETPGVAAVLTDLRQLPGLAARILR
jgi:FMN phosphatase YigB (HAD superfamily)